MSHFRIPDVKAPNIQQLQSSIQGQLAQHGYSSEDDPVMAEYIVVMLANQKTAEQITAEMKELIGGEYDAGFTEWVWSEAEKWVGGGGEAASTETGGCDGGSAVERRSTRQRRSRSPERVAARDQRRSRSPVGARREERRRSRSPQTQPQRREDVRYRMPRDHSSYEAWKASTAPRRGAEEPFDGEAFWRKKAQEKRTNPPPPVYGGARETRIFNAAYDQAVRNSLETHSSENAHRELFPDSTTSDDPPPPPYPASNGISIFGRAGIPDPRAPEFIPSSSSTTLPEASTSASVQPSIFARIDPMLPNNQPLPPPQPSAPTHSNDFPTAPTSTSICRWNLSCTNPVCIYSHASPANAGPGAGDADALVLSQQNCRYGAECGDRECTRAHVSPAVARIRGVPATRRGGEVLSMDTALPSGPGSRPCRFGVACTRADCFFDHPQGRSVGGSAGQVQCRFGLGCTRADCYYAHPSGQRASAVGNTAGRLAVFAQQGEEGMERVLPGSAEQAAVVADVEPASAST